MAGPGDQLKVAALRRPRFRIVHCKRAQNLTIFRNERFGPGRDEAVAKSQVASVVWPARIVGNVRNDHALFGKCGGTPRSPGLGHPPTCGGGLKSSLDMLPVNMRHALSI